MFKSITTKLILSYLVLVLVVMLVTSFFLLNILERYYITDQSTAISKQAALVAEFSVGYLRTTPEVTPISNLAENFARQFGARVIITDHRQRVVGDSVRVDGLVGSILEREEVARALSGEKGQSVQYSRKSEQWVIQVAVPVRDNEDILGTVFISTSLGFVYEVLAKLTMFLALATLLSLLLGGILGRFLADKITVPIKLLTEATEKMAHGELDQRVEVKTKDEIGQLAEQFNVMASRVQETTRQLREFVANASHELRTPLTSLNILVKSLRDYPLEQEERDEFIRDIDRELDRLTVLVEDLLEMTKLERVAGDEKMVTSDIAPLVEETVNMLRKRAEKNGIILSSNVPPQKFPARVVPHRIKQVVFNLVDNAVKFTPVGGKVDVALQRKGDRLFLTVADTGPGIPFSQREKVFERFYRVDKARSREQGGTGLGLAIVNEIVLRHGGRVSTEEASGGGALLVVELPAADEEEALYSLIKEN